MTEPEQLRHDVFLGPQRLPNGGWAITFEVHTINGKLACIACDEEWPCAAILKQGLACDCCQCLEAPWSDA